MAHEEPDFEISEASISGTHQRDDIFNQGARSRRHLLHITAQVSILVVIAVVASIIVVRAPLQVFLSAKLGTPTPVVTPRPLAQIDIQTNVSSRTLTVNGKAVPYNPIANNQSIDLTKQHSVITLTAPPFRPITCMIDTTELGQPQNGGRCNPNGNDNGITTLDMNFTLDDLPTLPRQQFDTYLAQKLSQLNAIQAQVPAKEHYALGTDAQSVPIVAVSPSLLQAQTHVSLNISEPLGYNGCPEGICPGNIFGPSETSQPAIIGFSFQMNMGWVFLNGAGRQVAAYLPTRNNSFTGNGPPIFADGSFNLQLRYDAKTGWSDINDISGQPGPSGYFNASDQLANNYCQLGSSVVDYLIPRQNLNPNGNGVSSFDERIGLAGCLFGVTTTNTQQNPGPQQTPTDPNADPTKDPNIAWFLVHFGAVLAVNAKAHALLPQLPQATAQEVTEVRQAPQG